MSEKEKKIEEHEVPASGGTELKDGGAPVQEIDPAAAETVKTESDATVESNLDKEDKDLKDQLKGDELSGQVLKPGHFARGETAGVSVVGTKARTLAATYETNDESVQVSDVDKSEKMAEIAQKEYARVESSYTMESTPVINEGEDGAPERVDEMIYPEKSMITTESIGGVHTKAPHGSPRVRENGKIFMRDKQQLILAGNTYLRSVAGAEGHDADKRLMQGENVLLNQFDEYGNIMTSFRYIKNGLFVVLGINPICGDTRPNDRTIGYVARKAEDDEGTTKTIGVPVTSPSHEFFRVREITPVMSDVSSAVGEFAKFLCADETKHYLAKYEAIHSTILRAEPQNEVSNEFNDFVEWAPEFKRGTLLVADRAYINGKISIGSTEYTGVDLSCFNNPSNLIETLDTLNQSEIALGLIFDNVSHIKEQLKFFRGLEGRMTNQPFWSAVFKGDPKAFYGKIPTMRNIFASYASNRAWDTPAKIIYGLGLFWRDMEALKSEFEGSALFNEYCAKVGVMKETIDKLCEAMCIGKVTDTKATSEDIVKIGSQARLVLGFDPNDFIGYSENTRNLGSIGNYGVNYYVPYICTGYAICGADRQHAPLRKFYQIAPKWIKALVTAFADKEFLQKHFLRLNSAGVLQEDSPIFYWWNATGHKLYSSNAAPFLPWVLDHYNTTWIDIILAKAICHADNDNLLKMESAYYNDGMTRFNKLLDKIGANEVLMDGRISALDAYKKITENALLYPNPNFVDMPDFEKLPFDVNQENPFAHEVAALAKVKTTANDNVSVALFAPTITRRRVFDLRMYEIVTTGITKVRYPSIMELLAETVGDNPTITLVPLHGGEAFIPFYTGTNKVVVMKNSFVKDDKGKIRVDVINDHADEKLLDVDARDPAKLMFGKDNFEWVTHYDYFVPVIHKGSEIARTTAAGAEVVSIDTQLQDFQVELCGALEVPGFEVSAVAGKEYSFYITAPKMKLPNNGKMRNSIYKTRNNQGAPAANSLVEVRSRNLKADTSNAIDSDVYESKYISKTAIPSLYGHVMTMFDYVADYYYKYTAGANPKLEISNGIRGVIGDAKVTSEDASEILKLKSKTIFGRTPEVIMYQRQTVFAPDLAEGYTEYSAVPTNLAEVRAKFELENVMPNDPLFHDRSVIFSFAHKDYAPNITGELELASMPYIFNVANLPVTKDVYNHVAAYKATTDAGTQTNGVRIGYTVKHLSKTENEIVADAHYRKGLNFRLPIIPELCTFDVLWDSAGVNDPTVCAIVWDAKAEPAELRSRAYCNDFRDYVVQSSIESLHEFWNKTNVSVSRFAKKYLGGE